MCFGTLVVEIEASDGTVGFSVTTGGELGCWIVEKHLARFIEGARVTDIEKIWDQMFNATLYYGRKGIVINTIQASTWRSGTCWPRCARSRCTRCWAARCATN